MQDELPIFGGQTRVLVWKFLAKLNGKTRPSSPASYAATPRSGSGDDDEAPSHSSLSSDGASRTYTTSVYISEPPSIYDGQFHNPHLVLQPYTYRSTTSVTLAEHSIGGSQAIPSVRLQSIVLPQNTMAHFEAPSPFFDPTIVSILPCSRTA